MGILVFFLRGLAWSYFFQPRAIQLFWGRLLGRFLNRLGHRKRVTEQNIQLAFPKQSAEEAKALLDESYEHLGILALEVFLLFGPMKRFIQKYSEITGTEHILNANKKGKGILFLSSHVGNWEIMAATGVLKAGLDLTLVTKKLKPSWLHQVIESGRKSCGVKATYEPKTLKDVLSALKSNRAVGFVLDQYAGPPVGIRVPLFGIPVGTSAVLATLAKRTGATVLPVESFRVEGGRWKVVIHAPVEWLSYDDPHYELAANTARYASILEGSIHRHPPQWLWTHRRFKGDLSPLLPEEWKSSRPRKG